MKTEPSNSHDQPLASQPIAMAICILAGGLSTRMGRKKERLKLGRNTLLQMIRATAASTGWPVRVLRKDRLKRCGPIGGIYTGLTTSRADAELFLACDMPFVSSQLMQKLSSKLAQGQNAVFASVGGTAGFPFVIRTTALGLVEQRIAEKQFSLQGLARKLRAKRLPLSRTQSGQVFNINTSADWQAARQMIETFKLNQSSGRAKRS